jgi:crotonobetainyl-CoA:carnitine CoA-transferase CaiB-like acyl-CoA transferase
LVALIEACTRKRPAAHWSSELESRGIPAGPINSIAEALADPQAAHRELLQVLDRFRLIASPLVLDGRRATSDRPPPALGQHTQEVLAELG